jgi:hypothetical protein
MQIKKKRKSHALWRGFVKIRHHGGDEVDSMMAKNQ